MEKIVKDIETILKRAQNYSNKEGQQKLSLELKAMYEDLDRQSEDLARKKKEGPSKISELNEAIINVKGKALIESNTEIAKKHFNELKVLQTEKEYYEFITNTDIKDILENESKMIIESEKANRAFKDEFNPIVNEGNAIVEEMKLLLRDFEAKIYEVEGQVKTVQYSHPYRFAQVKSEQYTIRR